MIWPCYAAKVYKKGCILIHLNHNDDLVTLNTSIKLEYSYVSERM